MFDFNWGIFWAVVAAFAMRGVIRAVLNYMEHERKRMMREHGNPDAG